MTAAQKTAKAKFKQAIAYRQKTGVTLKEAFANIYGKKKTSIIKKKSAPKKKTIGASNIPKASKSLANRLWDNCDEGIADQFTDAMSSMISIGRDLGFTFKQTMVAIKGNVDGVGNFYEDEF
jgi:hypothetical protein